MNHAQNPVSYIQHPTNIPLQLSAAKTQEFTQPAMPLGLIYNSDQAWHAGDCINIERPDLAPGMCCHGQVLWCREHRQGYQVGIAFYSSEDLYCIRMLEQVCHIDDYQREHCNKGNTLSKDAAANEWIEKFAAHFPTDGL